MKNLLISLLLVSGFAFAADPAIDELAQRLAIQTARVHYYEEQLKAIAQNDQMKAAGDALVVAFNQAKAKCETGPGRRLDPETLVCQVPKEADPLETDK